MPLFTCPSCRCQIDVDRPGQRVLCGSCGESVYIASATPAAQPIRRPIASHAAPTQVLPEFRVRVGQRKKKNPWPNVLVHCLISATAMVAGYKYILEPRLNRPKPNTTRLAAASQAKPRVRPLIAPVVSNIPAKPVPEKRPAEPTTESPTPAWVNNPKDPFEGFPAFVDLPPADNYQTVGLTGGVDAKLDLLAFDDSLKIDGTRIVHGDKTVAGVRVGDGLIEFKWLKSVPPASIDAVRNSVLKLTAGNDVHHLALRSPVKVKAESFDLERSRLSLRGKVDSVPPVEHVLFSMAPPVGFPIESVKGPDPARLKLSDETTLKYLGVDSATRITMRKVGSIAAAALDSRYVLPSGDTEPLSIARGNRKLQELEELLDEANRAERAIGGLKSHYQRLRTNLVNLQSRGQGFNENPAAVAARAIEMDRFSNEMAATDNNIARAERLIADKPSIEDDLAAIRRVAELARSLHNTPLPYRFFMVVDGVEVDLLIAE